MDHWSISGTERLLQSSNNYLQWFIRNWRPYGEKREKEKKVTQNTGHDRHKESTVILIVD